jgi:membrane protease subunit HflK
LLRGKARLPAVLVDESNRRLAAYRLGVQVEQASLTRLNPPDDVRDAFERVAQAQTGIVTQINQASQEADSKRQRAQADSFELLRKSRSYAEAQRLEAQAEGQAFSRRLEQYRAARSSQPDYLNVLWRDEVTRLFARLKETGQIDLLDHHLSGDGLNITQFPLGARKK